MLLIFDLGGLVIHPFPVSLSAKSVFGEYYRAAGGLGFFLLVILILALFQFARVSVDVYLSRWTEGHYATANTTTLANGTVITYTPVEWYTQTEHVWHYACLVGASMVLSALADIVLSTYTTRAASSIHNAAFENLLHAPLNFFYTTPIGRMLTRFSNDQDIVRAISMLMWSLSHRFP